MMMTTILAGGVLSVGNANARVLRPSAAPQLPSVEINFGAIEKLRGTEEFSLYKKPEEEKQIAKKEEVIAPVEQKELPPRNLAAKKEEPKEVAKKELPKKKTAKKKDSDSVAIAKPVRKPKNNEAASTKKVKLTPDVTKMKPEDVLTTDEQENDQVASIDTQPVNLIETKNDEPKKLSIGEPKEEAAIENTEAADVETAPEDSLSDRLKNVGGSILSKIPSVKGFFGSEDKKAEDKPAKIAKVEENELEALDLPPSLDDLPPTKDDAANADSEEAEPSQVAEVEELVEDDEAEAELAEDAEINEEASKVIARYGDDVQIILPNEIDKNDLIFSAPSPVIKPFEFVEGVAESPKEEPVIPEPVKVVEVVAGKPEKDIELSKHSDVRAIDDSEWNKILENAKQKAEMIKADNQEDKVDEPIEIAAVQEKAPTIEDKPEKERSLIENEEGDSQNETSDNGWDQEIADSQDDIEAAKPEKKSVLASVLDWMPSMPYKRTGATLDDVENMAGNKSAQDLDEKVEIADDLSEYLDVNEIAPSAETIESKIAELEVLEDENASDPVDLMQMDELADAAIPELAPIVEEKSPIERLMESKQRHLEEKKNVTTPDTNELALEPLKEFEVAALPQVTEIEIAEKAIPSDPDPVVDGLFMSLNFEGQDVDLAEFDANRITDMVQRIKDTQKRVRIVSYAPDLDGDANAARRISLKRAIAIRSQMIDAGLPSIRISVQAVGDKADNSAEPNSVSVTVFEG